MFLAMIHLKFELVWSLFCLRKSVFILILLCTTTLFRRLWPFGYSIFCKIFESSIKQWAWSFFGLNKANAYKNRSGSIFLLTSIRTFFSIFMYSDIQTFLGVGRETWRCNFSQSNLITFSFAYRWGIFWFLSAYGKNPVLKHHEKTPQEFHVVWSNMIFQHMFEPFQ